MTEEILRTSKIIHQEVNDWERRKIIYWEKILGIEQFPIRKKVYCGEGNNLGREDYER